MFNDYLIIIILIVIMVLIKNKKSKVIKNIKPIIHTINTINTFDTINTNEEPFIYNFDYKEEAIINIKDQPVITNAEQLKLLETNMVLNSWVPNTWIDSFDTNGKPIYKSRDDKTITMNSKIHFDYNNIENTNNKTIKEIYDNKVVNLKNLIQITETVQDNLDNDNYALF